MVAAIVAPSEFEVLIALLRERGYRVVGPTVRDGTVVHADLTGVDDLPRGWGDEQSPGSYRLVRRDDDALFGFTVGPHSFKRELFPPRQHLWEAVSDGDAVFHVVEPPLPDEPMAFVGVRPCELAAIGVQDRVFLEGVAADRVYAGRRDGLVLIAAECHSPAGSCFCASMGTGPGVDSDAAVAPGSAPVALADLVVTELFEPDHRLLLRADTDLGAELLEALEQREATDDDLTAREASLDAAVQRMGRHLDTDDLHDLLMGNLSHPRWDDVASRCLACTNCTMVCPTCFCTTVEDTTDLTGDRASRDRRWDSCFTIDFSHAGPMSVRTSTRARYRQWMTHKLATWIDQFDSSGCVGCGRCITWCPVGIDITEEAAAIRASDGREAVS